MRNLLLLAIFIFSFSCILYIPKVEALSPDHFDWRDNNGDWTTPVKFQGCCGSCWAFAVVSVIESQYNIAAGNPTLDLDLSEQYLVSDCCNSCGDCYGGWAENALAFIRDEGIVDEACFPYTMTNSPCMDKCADWEYRLRYIDEMGYVQNDIETIKGYLFKKGPLVAYMGTGSSFGYYWDDDIYRCANDCGANHAVVIVGYDEERDYWIVRNSWGGTGYLNVGYGECAIESHVLYATVTPPPKIFFKKMRWTQPRTWSPPLRSWHDSSMFSFKKRRGLQDRLYGVKSNEFAGCFD